MVDLKLALRVRSGQISCGGQCFVVTNLFGFLILASVRGLLASLLSFALAIIKAVLAVDKLLR